MQTYRFLPNNKVIQPCRSKGLDRKHAALMQCVKCQEELNEVIAALKNDEGQARVLEELADLSQAVEGVQRMFRSDYVRASFLKVAKKCSDRGDYEKPNDYKGAR